MTARLVAALDEISHYLAGIQRDDPQTDGYIAFLLAHAYARCGEPDRADVRAAAARARLAPYAADPVHAHLIALFSVRVDQAIAGLSPRAALPPQLAAYRAALGRELRVAIDSLRAQLRVLEPDPFDPLVLAQPIPPPREARSDDPASIEACLARAATADRPRREQLLLGALDAIAELDEDPAIPLLVQLLPFLDGKSLAIPARGLAIAARFGWGELCPPLASSFLAAVRGLVELGLEAADTAEPAAAALYEPLPVALHALRRLRAPAELRAVVTAVEPMIHEATPHRRLRLICAGVYAFLGEPRGLALLALAYDGRDRGARPHGPVGLSDLTAGYAHAPLDFAIDRLVSLARRLRWTPDDGRYYNGWMLREVEAISSAIAALTNDNPRDLD